MAAALVDILTRRQVTVQRLSAGEVRKVDAFIRKLDERIRAKLLLSELTTLARARLLERLEAIESALADILGDFQRDLFADLAELAIDEARFTREAVAVTTQFETVVPAPQQLRAAIFAQPMAMRGPGGGMMLRPFVRQWTAQQVQAVTNLIRLGVAQGDTNADITRMIRGTAAQRYADGVLAATKRNVDTVVHTSVQHIATVARMETFAANSDIIGAIRWVSTLDNRTCVRCGALDLLEFPVDQGPRPPLHPRCRCTVTAVFKGELAKLSRGGSRPSIGPNGVAQQSAGLNYYTWLKQQPAAFQDYAIGPSRGRLLRNGGLSSERFAQLQLDKRFMPLSLEDARRLEPLAFLAAGLD